MTQGSFSSKMLNAPHDLWSSFTFICESIKPVMFYEAFHKDLLSTSPVSFTS